MYTHIELWLSSVLLLLRRRKKDQRQEGILQETWHLDNYIYSHSCPRDICICQFIILFCKFVLFLMLLPVLGVWVEVIHQKKQQHITGLKIFCSLCPALFVQGCTSCTYSPGHTARPSGCRQLFLCIGPLGEAGLKHGVKAKGSQQEPREGKESESL